MILYVSFLAIPVLIIAQDNVEASYFLTAGLIFVICSSIDLFIFLPKILAMRQKNATTAETSLPSRWQMPDNRATEEKREEERQSENAGIQIFSASSKVAIEEENAKLKHVCMTLSKRFGLDYKSLINNDFPEHNLATENLDTEKLCMAHSKEDEDMRHPAHSDHTP